MTFFSRLFGKGEVPEWAPFFSLREHDRFLAAVEETLSARGLEYHIGNGTVDLLAGTGEPQHLGLQNLAQLCKASPAEKWPQLVATHFDNLFAAKKERELLEAEIQDYTGVRHLLKVRLFAEDLPDEVKQNAVGRFIAPGIVAVLAFDLPQTVMTVGRKEAEVWGVSDETMLGDALNNVESGEPVTPQIIDAGDGLRVHAICGESFFTASHVLLLDEHLPGRFEHGALVIVPNRHNIIFHPIEGATAIRAVQALLSMAWGMHRDGPGSISPNLYWWRDGELTLLPSAVENGGLQFYPPDEFTEMLNRIVQK